MTRRRRLLAGDVAFRERLLRVDPLHRDAWVDGELELGDLPEDGRDLPAGCVPYLPSSVDVVLRVIERAGVTCDDVFVDVGSGLGKVTMLVHMLTGAAAVGLEVQAGLAAQARRAAEALGLEGVRTLHGDAADLASGLGHGSVFFFYSPFGSERLRRVMEGIHPLARARPLRLCFADTPPPDVPWMVADPAPSGDTGSLTICRTMIHAEPRG